MDDRILGAIDDYLAAEAGVCETEYTPEQGWFTLDELRARINSALASRGAKGRELWGIDRVRAFAEKGVADGSLLEAKRPKMDRVGRRVHVRVVRFLDGKEEGSQEEGG